MNLSLHRYIVALSKCLLPVICMVLLTAQLTFESCCICFHPNGSGTAMVAQQPGGDGPGNLPNAHCHNKVYLSLDKRYDLRPVLFLPAPSFRVTALVTVRHVPAYFFYPRLAVATVRPACLRGPPSL
jgi:hypothetical protein